MKRRFFVLFLLGFSSGLPLCLVGTTLQAWFSVDSMSILAVSMLGLLGQPYMFKFLWSPWMDRFTIGNSERRRGWIYFLQTCLIILLLLLSFFSPDKHPMWMAGIALLTAFCSASQDTVIDAYRTEMLPTNERGLGTAFAVAGYRSAILLSGGLALVIAQYYGWQITYQCMAALLLIGILGNYFAPKLEKTNLATAEENNIRLWPALKILFSQKMGWQFIVFIFLYKLGEAFTSTSSSLTIPFFIQGLHFDLATVGIVNKIGGIAAAVSGGLIAGILLLRFSLFRSLLLFGVGQTFSVLIFLALAFIGQNLSLLITAVIIDNLVAGMSTTALLALMMGLCDRRFTATHFAFLSAVSAFPRVIAGPIGGVLQGIMGWKGLYLIVFFATWPCLILLCYLFFPNRNILSSLNASPSCEESKNKISSRV
jgi:PAT family beta-lactamase induction signal transducer AmpG